jgi:PAS domain S-box-containing protein
MYRTRIGQVVSAVSAHDRLYAMFERSSDPMILLDPHDRRIVDANEAYGRLVGHERDEVIGLRPYEHAVGREPGAPIQKWREIAHMLLEHPATVFSNRREMQHRDGSTTFVQWTYSGVTVAGRGLVLVVGVPVDAEPATQLTERELEIVRLLALGKRGSAIAIELFISPDTVETHTRNARLKLGAATLAELVAKALSSGRI